MKNKVLSSIFAILMFVLCIPMNVLADSFVVAGEKFNYSLNDSGTYTITGYYGGEEIIEIPSHINGIPVTELGAYSLYNLYAIDVSEIIIPETVSEIGECALTNNGKLMNIEVSEDNPYLCDVDGVLYNKDVTTLIYYPEGRDDVTYSLPDTVTTLGKYCFNFAKFETLIPSKNLKNIDYRAFHSADIKEITLPFGVETIGDSAFLGCSGLTEIIVPDSVITLGYDSFSRCSGLKSVYLGAGLREVLSGAFEGCSSLEKITVSPDNQMFIVVDDVLFSKDLTALYSYPAQKPDVSYTVPATVKTITAHAFYKAEYLESISFPDTLENLSLSALRYLPALKTVRIPDGIKEVRDNFSDCDSLESVYLGKSVYDGCSIFRLCDSLTSFEVSEENSYLSAEDGVLFSKDKTVLCKFPAGLDMNDYDIPDKVKEVESGAFSDQDGYDDTMSEDGKIYVDDCLVAVERVGNTLNVRTGTRIIANRAFEMVYSRLYGVSLPDEIRYIGERAFVGCYYLQGIYIPDGIKYIGDAAFSITTDAHLDIYYGGTEAQWNMIENIEKSGISENVTIHFESEGNELVNPVLPEDMYDNTYVDEHSGVSVSTDTDAELNVEDIKTQDVVDSVAELLPKAKVESVYEINLSRDGEEVQPDDRVFVKIPARNPFACVYRMEEDGTLTDMNAWYEGGYLCFYTEHFSYYALGMKQAEHYEIGDVDMNETLNVRDATAIQKHLADVQEFQPDVIELLMDFNSDSNVNVKDATAVQKRIAGLD